MALQLVLRFSVIALYLLSTLSYSREFLAASQKSSRWAGRFFELAFLIQTILIFAESFSQAPLPSSEFHLPVATVGEASSFFAWALAFVYLISLRQRKVEAFGAILGPVLILFFIPSFFSFPVNEESLKHFHDAYFLLHILTAFFAYASFALSFISAALYLILDRALKRKPPADFFRHLLPLEDLEQLMSRTILWGLVLLSGAIVSGAFWS